MDKILRLYPLPAEEIPLTGAYLAHDLRRYAEQAGKPFVYTNFVASLDGRIAIPHSSGRGLVIPKAIANERDWRLFQEAAAQADIIISSGRYLRELAAGQAPEIVQVDDPVFSDLRAWREGRGIPAHPDLAILSGSLDFTIPKALTAGGRRVVVFTSAEADPLRAAEIEAQGGQVFVAGERGIDGALMVERLAELGYRTVYSSAGPKILYLLITGGVLDRLYLTLANRLLAGHAFASMLEGPLLEPPAGMKISHIYLDPQGMQGAGQLFITYDRA
jgi:riboflavin biosynthesis pyrimidine reductase